MQILGIDIGGSGIKGAIVETESGELLRERYRLATPNPSLPENVAETVKQIVDHFNWEGPVGCSFPAIVANGICYTAGNISPEWIGTKADDLFSQKCYNIPFFIANDADMAGLAEMKLGAGEGKKGKVLLITIGTGLGSGLFYNGTLIPNTEFGHMFYKKGIPIEKYASDAVRKSKDLKLKKWAKRFDFFLIHLVRTICPDWFIIGGGLSKKFEKFKKYLTVDVPVSVAKFENNAGIIGAALFAEQQVK